MVGKKNGTTATFDSGTNGHQFVPGDIVLGKIKGYPPWPGILCDEENVPKKTVLNARPGKSYHIVRFFPAADYGFNTNRDLRLLSKREIEAYLSDSHKRAGDLRNAYKLALDPREWNQEQDDAVREAEEADENEDQLEEEGDEDEDEVQPVKKRKQPSSKSKSGSSNKKVKSVASTGTPASEEKEKKPSSATAAPISSTSASHAASSHSHKDSAEAEGGDEAELDPETKKVKGWRHALQRGFLPKDGHINADDMEQHDKTFKQVEDHLEMTISQLRLTKIGKVMKRILQLSNIPHDDKFRFQERAQKLCDRWSEVMTGGGAGISGGNNVSPKKEESIIAQPKKEEQTTSQPKKEESSLPFTAAVPPLNVASTTTKDETVSEEPKKVNGGGEQSSAPTTAITNGSTITSNGNSSNDS